jgi:hypothetical protein
MSLNQHGNYYNFGMDPHDGFGDNAGLSDCEIEMHMHEDASTS